MGFFSCINIRHVPWEVLKTAACGFRFQHLPRDLANVNAWKTMFDPYREEVSYDDSCSSISSWSPTKRTFARSEDQERGVWPGFTLFAFNTDLFL